MKWCADGQFAQRLLLMGDNNERFVELQRLLGAPDCLRNSSLQLKAINQALESGTSDH